MSSMAEKQLNVEVPDALHARLDELQSLMDWSKKGMVTAALAVFLRATDEERFQWVKQARREYLTDEPTTDVAQQAADVLAEGGRQRRRGKPA